MHGAELMCAARLLIARLCTWNPLNRPTALDALHDPYFAELRAADDQEPAQKCAILDFDDEPPPKATAEGEGPKEMKEPELVAKFKSAD